LDTWTLIVQRGIARKIQRQNNDGAALVIIDGGPQILGVI
jgi:cobyric acid synthase